MGGRVHKGNKEEKENKTNYGNDSYNQMNG